MNVKVSDISFYQTSFNAHTMAGLLNGVILRAGQGSWADDKYRTFRAEAQGEGFPDGAYWYYDNRHAPKRQAEKWAETLGDKQPPLGCWLDLENSYIGDYGKWNHWYDCLEYFKQIFNPSFLGIYTRASYFDPLVPVAQRSYFGKYPLWVAHYYVDKPDIPLAWSDWLLWQFTERGDGHLHGVGSSRIDLNHFNGDAEKFKSIFQLGNIPPNDTPLPPIGENMIATLKSNSGSGRALRPETGTDNAPLGYVPSEETMNASSKVVATRNDEFGAGTIVDDEWYFVEGVHLKDKTGLYNGWMAAKHGGVWYCVVTPLSDPQPEPTPNPEPVPPFDVHLDFAWDGTKMAMKVNGVDTPIPPAQ